MTTRSPLMQTFLRYPLLRTPPALVVALLLSLSGAGWSVRADDGHRLVPGPVARSSSVEGTVSKVTGTVLDLIEGQIQIDVAKATITGGDDREANPLPASGILVGARVVALVTVPDVIAAVFPPPPLAATHVLVFQTRSGQLAGTIQSVDAGAGTFTLLFRSVSTNAATKWSGDGTKGRVKGIGDLSAGMFATVSVVSSGGLLATEVEAFDLASPPHLISFRGPVQSIAPAQWQIAGRLVQVDSDTKIVGDPVVGDDVDVLAEAPTTPPGAGTAVIPVALSILKERLILPPGPGDRSVEFDGTVESIPAPTNGSLLGRWKISGRDVTVNGLTKLDSGIAVGAAVHVKGSFQLVPGAGGMVFGRELVAGEIRKR